MYHFNRLCERYRDALLESKPVDAGSWHSIPTNGNPMLVTMELPFTSFTMSVPQGVPTLQEYVKPNLPWAEDHFLERVSGVPLNPAPSHAWWPWAHKQHQDSEEKFSHTYPERFWPKQAGDDDGHTHRYADEICYINHGIRYGWGDLADVVHQLINNPYTRQAVLPVFFPEDTGGSDRTSARIPCSLTYNFLYRDGHLHCHYTMRSCDFVRHFRDDVYMAARLMQWVCGQMVKGGRTAIPGTLHTSITSLHAMEGDRWKMTEEKINGTR